MEIDHEGKMNNYKSVKYRNRAVMSCENNKKQSLGKLFILFVKHLNSPYRPKVLLLCQRDKTNIKKWIKKIKSEQRNAHKIENKWKCGEIKERAGNDDEE